PAVRSRGLLPEERRVLLSEFLGELRRNRRRLLPSLGLERRPVADRLLERRDILGRDPLLLPCRVLEKPNETVRVGREGSVLDDLRRLQERRASRSRIEKLDGLRDELVLFRACLDPFAKLGPPLLRARKRGVNRGEVAHPRCELVVLLGAARLVDRGGVRLRHLLDETFDEVDASLELL